MEKNWIRPEIEVLEVKETANGWNAWKLDWSWQGLPLIGERS